MPNALRRVNAVTPTNNGGSGLKPWRHACLPLRLGYSHQQRWERIETYATVNVTQDIACYSHQQRWERIETRRWSRPIVSSIVTPTNNGGSGLKPPNCSIIDRSICYSHQQRWERIETLSVCTLKSSIFVTPTNNGGSGLKHRWSVDRILGQRYSHQQRWERIEAILGKRSG